MIFTALEMTLGFVVVAVLLVWFLDVRHDDDR